MEPNTPMMMNEINPDRSFAARRLVVRKTDSAEPYRACLKNPRILALIRADQDRVSAAGARATPSFLVNDQLIEGAVPIEPLRKTIDAALAASKR